MENATETKNIDEALRLDSLKLPPKPRIVKIEWDFYEDSMGEESLKILLLLDDSTTDKELKKAPVHAIKRAIRDSLTKHKIRLFPYFYFDRKGEYEARKAGE
ncbi:MAG TPA: hypothetical protein VGX76_13950 [Pirellulales bacterium]|jgi:hypothetical protein|nr:hypothetical protein [Pirellulales bacterium]